MHFLKPPPHPDSQFNSGAKLNYIKEIEGLRALAIMLIVLFHAGFQYLPGCYAGVDIFFVISGFLISRSIDSNICTQKFSLLAFYDRRVRRIVPAAVFIVLLVVLIGRFTMFPEELVSLFKSGLAALTMRSNFYAAQTTDYFGIGSERQPFLHLWSLSIELQFYVLFPLVVLLTMRLSRNFTIFCLLFICSVSFGYAASQISKGPTAGYYSSTMRVWQFLLGVNLWYFYSPLTKVLSGHIRRKSALSFLGILLILYSIASFDARSHFPGANALIPCVGACLALLFSPGTIVGRILSSYPLLRIGTISFSLYLVHQPIFALYRTFKAPEPGLFTLGVLVLLAVAISVLLWRYLEIPCQSRAKCSGILLYSIIVPLIICGAVVSKSESGLSSQARVSPYVNELLKYRYDNNPRVDECRTGGSVIDPLKACVYGEPDLPSVALWGDSHADQLVVPLASAMKDYGYSVKEFALAACPPISDVTPAKQANHPCEQNISAILDYLVSNPDIKHIFLHAYWTGYIDGGLIVPAGGSKTENSQAHDSNSTERILRSFRKVISALVASGKSVYLIYPAPKMNVNPPLYLARKRLMWGERWNENTEVITVSYMEYLRQSVNARKMLDAVAGEFKLKKIHLDTILCRNGADCIANDGDQIYYRDDNHLSVTGGFKVAPMIAESAFSSAEQIEILRYH